MTITMLLVNTIEAAERRARALPALPNAPPHVRFEPLLQIEGLPAFDRIRAEHVKPAIEHWLREADSALERAVAPETPADYDALSLVLDVALERLNQAWASVSHLNAVADSPELRAAYNEALGPLTEFHTRLGADQRLYAKYKAVAATSASSSTAMSAARRQTLSNAMRDFVLTGAELQGAARERFARIHERMAELSQAYSEHVLDATDGFGLDVDEGRLGGLPPDALAAARDAAQRAGANTSHRLTLHAPIYSPAMQYLQDRQLREALHVAYITRASELGPQALDNSASMRELLELRHEEAQLLGHPHYAALSLVPKMAQSTAQVIDFLRDLGRRARPHAQRDLGDLRAFAASELGIDDLQPWDQTFASERLRQARFSYSEQEVKLYFTLPRVLQGLFGVIETLFDVAIFEDSAPVWHESVRFFRIERRTRPGELLAQFYLDPHARPGKRPGAWMAQVRSRWARPDTPGRMQTPVAHLVCNFASPQGGRPALLSHGDVITLFHEFGHGLHHLLTQVHELGVSGIAGVEWDAVELPSQFMENLAWEWEVLRRMTAHVDSAEPLPRALFDKMLAARNFQSGLGLLRQVEFALCDMRLHGEPDAAARIDALVAEVRTEVSVVPVSPKNRYAHAFAHIFAGGYAAGYYSYKWAEVLSADAWSAFEEAGALDAATGARYLQEILESGGSRPALESFKAFRGREPRIDALLRHQGMS